MTTDTDGEGLADHGIGNLIIHKWKRENSGLIHGFTSVCGTQFTGRIVVIPATAAPRCKRCFKDTP